MLREILLARSICYIYERVEELLLTPDSRKDSIRRLDVVSPVCVRDISLLCLPHAYIHDRYSLPCFEDQMQNFRGVLTASQYASRDFVSTSA